MKPQKTVLYIDEGILLVDKWISYLQQLAKVYEKFKSKYSLFYIFIRHKISPDIFLQSNASLLVIKPLDVEII